MTTLRKSKSNPTLWIAGAVLLVTIGGYVGVYYTMVDPFRDPFEEVPTATPF
jgi:hypothetical protein